MTAPRGERAGFRGVTTADPLILRDEHERQLWLEQQRSWRVSGRSFCDIHAALSAVAELGGDEWSKVQADAAGGGYNREPTPSSDPRVDTVKLRDRVQDIAVDMDANKYGLHSREWDQAIDRWESWAMEAFGGAPSEPRVDVEAIERVVEAVRRHAVFDMALPSKALLGSWYGKLRAALGDTPSDTTPEPRPPTAELSNGDIDALFPEPSDPPKSKAVDAREGGATPTGPGWWCVEAFLRLDDDGAMEHYWRSVEVTECDGTLVFETLEGKVSPCRGFKWNGPARKAAP